MKHYADANQQNHCFKAVRKRRNARFPVNKWPTEMTRESKFTIMVTLWGNS